MTIQIMLTNLKKAIRSGVLTPAKIIDGGTFVCIKETNLSGETSNYHQLEFENIPEAWREQLKGQGKGFTIGNAYGTVKVIAVFDAWGEKAA